MYGPYTLFYAPPPKKKHKKTELWNEDAWGDIEKKNGNQKKLSGRLYMSNQDFSRKF